MWRQWESLAERFECADAVQLRQRVPAPFDVVCEQQAACVPTTNSIQLECDRGHVPTAKHDMERKGRGLSNGSALDAPTNTRTHPGRRDAPNA